QAKISYLPNDFTTKLAAADLDANLTDIRSACRDRPRQSRPLGAGEIDAAKRGSSRAILDFKIAVLIAGGWQRAGVDFHIDRDRSVIRCFDGIGECSEYYCLLPCSGAREIVRLHAQRPSRRAIGAEAQSGSCSPRGGPR